MLNILIQNLKQFKIDADWKLLKTIVPVVTLILFISAFAITWVEPAQQFDSFGDAIWWTFVTATTVGYGDTYPITLEGRIIAIILMMIGIGSFGVITAKFADLFIDLKKRRELGEVPANYKNHLIICGWCNKTKEIINQALNESFEGQEDKNDEEQIVLVANIERDPFPDNKLIHFVKGSIDKEDSLKKAGVMDARIAIVLNEDNNDRTTVLSALTIENLNPNVYTITEVSNKENKVHLRNANVDEIILNEEINSQLLVRSAFHAGTSEMISELLSNKYGNQIYMSKPKKSDIGEEFINLVKKYKQKENSILIAVKNGREVITNPDSNHIINANEELVYLGTRKF
ncbi:MAG: potassium channel family protein [Bacillota bacterium]